MAKSPLLKGERALFLAVILTIVLFNIPYGRLVLYPFALLATWFHEMGHGLTAMVLGASFESLVLRPDTSGFATYRFDSDFGRISRGLTASAGYLGTGVVGAILLALRSKPSFVRASLGGIGVALIASALLVVLRWPGSNHGQEFAAWLPLFGGAVTLGWGGFLIYIARGQSEDLRLMLYNLIAAQTALNAVLNIQHLYRISGGSDAHTMADLFFLPASIWATLWLGGAIALALGGYWLGRRRA